MSKTIPDQSGMDFIAENSFYIEESDAYKKHHKVNGIRSVEFIRVKGNTIYFIEAKPSFPNPNNPYEDNKKKFDDAVCEICEKFIHSLNLYSSIEVGVTEVCYPTDFVRPKKASLTFLLVMNNS